MLAGTDFSPPFPILESSGFIKEHGGSSEIEDESSDVLGEALKQIKIGKPPRHLSGLRHCLSSAVLIASELGLDSQSNGVKSCANGDDSSSFVPVFRSGSCSEKGPVKQQMEDEHICIDNLLEHDAALDFPSLGAFYGVFDGHGGLDAATFVRENILKFIVEDAHFPNCVENAIRSAFVKADHAFSDNCSLDSSSGTTALTALIFGRKMLIANAGDCRAVLGKRGKAVELSKDHKPDCKSERLRIVELGGYVVDGYLNGQLSVTRALGDWHMKGSKGIAYPLSAEPELQETILTEEDEFLIMGCDGLWDVISSQCAVTIVRRELMLHNDPERCAVELVNEALKWKACDNLTVIVVCFSPNPPPRLEIPRFRVRRCISAEGLNFLKNVLEKRIRTAAASSAESDSSIGWNGEPNYHPFEEFGASTDDSVLTPAETCRTLIEVNSKATLMFSGMVDNQVHENIFWPDLPYLTDEHGNIYFEVNEDEDILKTMTSEENYVQVIIGLDTKEMLSEMELGQAEIDYGMEEIGDEDSEDDDDDGGEGDEGTDDDDYDDEDWVSVLEGDEDETDSEETLGDWAKLETMRSSHPMYFAKKMSEVASDDPMDWMDQPPAGLAIQGLLRPSFFEENSTIRKQSPEKNSDKVDINKVGTAKGDSKDNIINGQQDKSSSTDSSEDGADQSGKDLNPRTSFYMLEMAKIQLVSSDGNQSVVEVNDFQNAKPDAIAHSADKIMSRLKAGGEKTTQALKSLCLRVKGIQVEEATVVGVDSLGFDLRVCSGTQVQTLRFAFSSRTTSEYSTERQFHELLFPRSQLAAQKRQETSPTESEKL